MFVVLKHIFILFSFAGRFPNSYFVEFEGLFVLKKDIHVWPVDFMEVYNKSSLKYCIFIISKQSAERPH